MAATSTMNSNDPISANPPRDLADNGGKTVRVFNARLALCTLLALAVLGPAVYGWHYYQLQRTARAFLERADQLESEGSWVASADYMRRYLSLHPEDDAARIRMTRTFDRGAKDWPQRVRAVDLYYQTLGLIASEEEKPRLRRRLTEMLLEMRRFAEAETEAARLLETNEKDASGRRFLALAVYGQMKSGAAVGRSKGGPPIHQVLDLALQSNPGDIQLSAMLAEFYRGKDRLLDEKKQEVPRAEREKKADLLIDQMIKANPASADAYLVRYCYCVQKETPKPKPSRLPVAEEDLRLALKFGPDNIDVLLVAAEKARQEGMATSRSACFQEARAHYEHILQIAPSDERCYAMLGDLNFLLRDVPRALETWRRGLEKEANKDSKVLHLRLAGALVALGRIEEAAAALKTLDALIVRRGALMPAVDRAALESTRDFIRAKWWLLQRDLASALPLLKRVVNQGTEATNTPQSYEAWSFLGQIWEAGDEWDQAAAAYEQASLLKPQSADYKLSAAKAWANVGRYDTAIRYGEQALAIKPASETWLILADTHYRQQIHRPKSQRDWQPFRRAFAEAVAAAEKKSLSEPWRLRLLQAGALLAGAMDKSSDKARVEAAELLRATESEHPRSAALLQSLPLLFECAGYPADADRAAASLGKLPGRAFPALLCRVQLCVSRKQYAKAREALKAGLDHLPSERLKIRLALSGVSVEEGRPKQAFEELVELHKEFPNHLPLLRQLAEMACSLGKIEESQRWDEKLREREGPDGFYWRYYRATRLSAEIQDVKDKRFHEAEKLVDELLTLRPSSSRTHLLRAQVEQKRGNREQAIDAYSNAIRLGERRIEVYEQLTKLLYEEQRFVEAEEYLAQLQEQVPLSESLSTLEISVAAETGRLDRALALARRGVESPPKEPMAQIWLAQVLLANGQTKEAEQVSRRAVQMAPADARTHNVLFVCYLRTSQLELAAKILEDLDKNVKMSAADRAFILAQGYERICKAGKNNAEFVKKASHQYQEAQRLNPDRMAVLQQRAIFLINRDPAAAEEVLRAMLKLDPRSSIARQLLAALLASRGGEKEWQESQELIETPGVPASASEQRLQATLLAHRGGKENLLKARRILEKLTADTRNSLPRDVLLLAWLLEGEGKTALAKQQYLVVVNRPNATSTHLAQYITFLLRNDMDKDAAPWFEKLRQQLPDDLGVCGWHAQWLHGQRRDSEIEPAIEAFAKRLLEKPSENDQQRTARESQLSLALGNICTAVEHHSAAERWYRRLVKLAPQQYAPLAMSLGRQNRLGEAMALYVEMGKTDHSARPAIALACALSSSKTGGNEEVFRRAEPLLTQALASHPKDADLLSSVAGVRVLQQRTDEAIDLYRRVLSLKPKDVQTLNNLATMLAEQPRTRQEALRLIDEAIGLAGRISALLDTKGTILVQDGKAEEAEALLKEAAVGSCVDARFLFHLSLACQGAGKSDEARKALRRARNGNLTQQMLTASDLRLLKELEQQLGM